jgi:hypothetical protein
MENGIFWDKLRELYWFLFERNNFYCPRCFSNLKNSYCKKCDIVYWRGTKLNYIRKENEEGI